jgi:hypothetical protein
MDEFGFIYMVKDNMNFLESGRLLVVPGSDVTLKDVKASKVIWGCSALKMKRNTVRRNNKKVVQIIIKVPTEFIKLHQVAEFVIDVFFVYKHIFFITYSMKICFTVRKNYLGSSWGHTTCTYRRFPYHCDQEFSVLNALTTVLPNAPHLD